MKLEEIYRSNAYDVGRDIAARTGAKGIGLAAKKDEEDAEYQREQIAELKAAIAKNPDWAKGMLPKMQARLAKHEAQLAAIEGQKK